MKIEFTQHMTDDHSGQLLLEDMSSKHIFRFSMLFFWGGGVGEGGGG